MDTVFGAQIDTDDFVSDSLLSCWGIHSFKRRQREGCRKHVTHKRQVVWIATGDEPLSKIDSASAGMLGDVK